MFSSCCSDHPTSQPDETCFGIQKGECNQSLRSSNFVTFCVSINFGFIESLFLLQDKAGKSRLIERIQARNKWLRVLRTLDYEKFEWLLRELKIKHVPVVKYNRKESRQAERKRLAREEGMAIREAKIAEFREKLEEEQLNFLEHREQEMADIEQQLKELGITEFSTLEGALEALGMSHTYERRPPYIKRRTLLLRKKFEQYGLKCKKKGKQAVVMQ